MADSLDVLTLAEAKVSLRIGLNDVSFDDRLAAAITNVSRQIDRFVGPVIKRTIATELHDGDDWTLWTRFMPVFSITTVTEYRGGIPTVLVADTPSSLVDGYLAAPYRFDPSLLSGELIRRSGNRDKQWAPGRRNVDIAYVAGRVATVDLVDPRYKEAAQIVLRNLWRADAQSIAQVGEYAVPTPNFPHFAIPNAVRELLGEEWQQRPGFA